MKKMFVKYHTGYAGMDGYELLEFDDSYTEEQIAEEVFWQAVQHAESYGVELCPEGDDCDYQECEFEHLGSTNIEGYAVPYDPEKHDCYLR